MSIDEEVRVITKTVKEVFDETPTAKGRKIISRAVESGIIRWTDPYDEETYNVLQVALKTGDIGVPLIRRPHLRTNNRKTPKSQTQTSIIFKIALISFIPAVVFSMYRVFYTSMVECPWCGHRSTTFLIDPAWASRLPDTSVNCEYCRYPFILSGHIVSWSPWEILSQLFGFYFGIFTIFVVSWFIVKVLRGRKVAKLYRDLTEPSTPPSEQPI